MCSPIVKRGPAAGAPTSITEPLAPVSDAPKLSITITSGSAARNSSLTAFDRMAPPEPITASAVRSKRPSCPPRASASGRAMASPTTINELARSRSTMRQISSAS